MFIIKIAQFSQKRVLTSRLTAQAIVNEFAKSAVDSNVTVPQEFQLEFSGTETVTPSFFDEILVRLEEFITSKHMSISVIHLLHFPNSLGDFVNRIADGHNLQARQLAEKTWELRSVIQQRSE